MARIPSLRPTLPISGESFIGTLVHGGTQQVLAEYANWLQGYHFKRHTPIIVRPFSKDNKNGNDSLEEIHIPIHSDTRSSYLFVAIGVSAVKAGGFVTVSVKDDPPEIAGQATPGAGDLYDPGCAWFQIFGDLLSPIEDREYTEHGLRWVTTELAAPPDRDVGDPQNTTPRLLHIDAGSSQEIHILWSDCIVNSVCLWEVYRGSMAQQALIVGVARLVISEIDYDRPGNHGEFIEVYNAGTGDQDLTGVVLEYWGWNGVDMEIQSTYPFAGVGDGTLAPGERLVVGNAWLLALVPGGVKTITLPNYTLNNVAAGVKLMVGATRADSVSWKAPWGGIPGVTEGTELDPDTGAASWQRYPTDGTDTENNTADFHLSLPPRPGQANN